MFYELLEKSTLKKGRSYWKVKITFLNLFHIFLLIYINLFQISPKIITIVDVGMQVGYAVINMGNMN